MTQLNLTLMNKIWTIWKHALGSYSEQDGFDPTNDNAIAIIRTVIVCVNILVGFLISANIIIGWI